jgi:hypothetical protein
MPSPKDFDQADEQARKQARATRGARPTNVDRGIAFPQEDALVARARRKGYALDFDPRYDQPRQPAPSPRAQRGARAQPVLGSGGVAIDLNHTPFTALEGHAANNRVSIQRIRPFNPLTENGIALTTAQARQLGIRVGDVVTIRDTATGRSFRATYYDNAGVRPGADNLGHFEVDPALADALGISYHNRSGQVVDAVTNSREVDGRFRIER